MSKDGVELSDDHPQLPCTEETGEMKGHARSPGRSPWSEPQHEMVGWHRRLNGHEFEQTPGGSEGQGRPACCSPRGHKDSDTTEQHHEPGFPTELTATGNS